MKSLDHVNINKTIFGCLYVGDDVNQQRRFNILWLMTINGCMCEMSFILFDENMTVCCYYSYLSYTLISSEFYRLVHI